MQFHVSHSSGTADDDLEEVAVRLYLQQWQCSRANGSARAAVLVYLPSILRLVIGVLCVALACGRYVLSELGQDPLSDDLGLLKGLERQTSTWKYAIFSICTKRFVQTKEAVGS